MEIYTEKGKREDRTGRFVPERQEGLFKEWCGKQFAKNLASKEQGIEKMKYLIGGVYLGTQE